MEKLDRTPIIHCPDRACGEVMIYDRKGFYTCPRCGGEFWPDEEKKKEIEREQAAIEEEESIREQCRRTLHCRYTEVMPLVPVVDPKKRNSQKSGRKRKYKKLQRKYDYIY